MAVISPFAGVFCVCCASVALAQPPSSEFPVWFHPDSKTDSGLMDVFNAFHSGAGPAEVKHRAVTPSTNVAAIYPAEFRTLDGEGNNPTNLGAAGAALLRQTTVGYEDGVGSPAGADRNSARFISNKVDGQTVLIPNGQGVSSFVWLWGQFVDHDISLSRVSNPAEQFNIPVPQCDPQFDPNCTGKKNLPFQRSAFAIINGIRQQLNANTAFIDASQVYGSGNTISQELRDSTIKGHLKISDGNFLPFNVDGFPNQPDTTATFFLAGDVRSNENAGLTALQILFMREHNRWADIIAVDPKLNDRDVYFRARAIVGAEIQLITYRDFIPLLLGPNALDPYLGYNSAVDPSASNEFSAAAFRMGHTLLPDVFKQLDSRNRSLGDVSLGQTFFNPKSITGHGIDPILRGLAKQIPQQSDPYVIDAVRNFLVGGKPNRGGFDLVALDIQRGRDHGLPGYNQVRIDFGLPPKATFADMTSDGDLQLKLAAAYTSPDDVDFFVGSQVEPLLPGAQVGETLFVILKDQFQRLRDGDRFWYESYLDPATLALVQAQTLSSIIRANTLIGTELQNNAFVVP